MKTLAFAFLCTLSVATHCNTLEKTESPFPTPAQMEAKKRHSDKQAVHTLVIGNTIFWACIGTVASGSAAFPIVGAGVIAAHVYKMNQNNKILAEKNAAKIIAQP